LRVRCLPTPKPTKNQPPIPSNISINIWQKGHFKRQSFAHAWCKDACAVWLHSSAILGLAGLGEAFGRHDWIVFCGGMGMVQANVGHYVTLLTLP